MIRVLTADVGGTKTRLALYEGPSESELVIVRDQRRPSADEDALEPIVERFLDGKSVDAAGFGVPGPVVDGLCLTTNLPWVVQLDALRATCGTQRCVLRNDAEMAALGLPVVSEASKVWLQPGQPRKDDPMALVTIGTGYGRALLLSKTQVFASEAGHASFAARHAMEIRLLEHLLERHEQVAIEHVLSGPGLASMYDTLRAADVAQPAPSTTDDLARADDKSARIGELGLTDADPLCAATIAWFAELLGAELGNVALETLPRGGLYIWGGVARKLKPVLCGEDLLEAFRDKDRMRAMLETIPLALIDDADLALLGAREAALRT